MKYKNSNRVGDIRVGDLSKDQIIKLLYDRLYETDKTLKQIKNLVNSSFGTKDITDFNSEILNPLWKTFNETNN